MTHETTAQLRTVVTDSLISMIAAVTGTVPPADTPPPPFIQGPIDRAMERISAAIAQQAAPEPQKPTDAMLDDLRRRGLSIDGDNQYKRDVCDAIIGALCLGSRGTNPPPEGHWGSRFWEIGRAEGRRAEQDQEQIRKLQAMIAQQAAPVAVPDDWRLVPVEPSDEMLECDSIKCHCGHQFSSELFRHAWSSMIAAAPTPPAQQQNQPQNIPEIIPAVAPVAVPAIDVVQTGATNWPGGHVPDGWKLVPVEPTPEMIDAGNYQCRNDECCLVGWDTSLCESCQDETATAYDRMLSAAPTPPASPWESPCTPPAQQLDLKLLCTHFYYWWHNQPGTNTEQGFDAWFEAHGRALLPIHSDTAPPAQQPDEWPAITKPAKIGSVRFEAGVSSRTVIEAAQRQYEYDVTPKNEAERIARFDRIRAAVLAPPAPEQTEQQCSQCAGTGYDCPDCIHKAEQDDVKVPRELLGMLERASEIMGWVACRADIRPKDMRRIEESAAELRALLEASHD